MRTAVGHFQCSVSGFAQHAKGFRLSAAVIGTHTGGPTARLRPDRLPLSAVVCCAFCSTRFEVAPNTLVLCLKRFGTGRFGKINKVLVYGEQLDLGPFMARGATDDAPATYTLTGVVVHLDQVR